MNAVPKLVWQRLLNVSLMDRDPDYIAKEGLHARPMDRWGDARQIEFVWPILFGEQCVAPVTDLVLYERATFDPLPLRPQGTWAGAGCFRDEAASRALPVELFFRRVHIFLFRP